MMEAQELPVIFAAAALAIAAYSSSVSVGLFTKIFAVNGKRKRQLESFFFFFCTVYNLCTFFRATEAQDGKDILSPRG